MLVTAALVVVLLRARMYALKVHDRVIRLEEPLRLQQLLDASWRPRIMELTESQLIALRFASDEEIPALVQRVMNEKLPPKDIRQAIRDWRPDHWRV